MESIGKYENKNGSKLLLNSRRVTKFVSGVHLGDKIIVGANSVVTISFRKPIS